MNLMNRLRKIGRKYVLPVEEIGAVLSECLKTDKDCLKIIDFGSGTLFWTEYIINNINCRYEIYAVDPIYNTISPTIETNNKNGRIFLYDDIEKLLDIHEKFDIIFMCDVIHHLEPLYWDRVFDLFLERIEIFVIKDINALQKIGNKLNKLHDKLINRENIVDVYPESIRDKFIEKGFSVSDTKLVRKLWYPHFVIKANKL